MKSVHMNAVGYKSISHAFLFQYSVQNDKLFENTL
jgi:hypothetical protein